MVLGRHESVRTELLPIDSNGKFKLTPMFDVKQHFWFLPAEESKLVDNTHACAGVHVCWWRGGGSRNKDK